MSGFTVGLTWQDVETVYTLIYGWGGRGEEGRGGLH